ncbi:MAG: methylenetetrahydrofolate reductase [NAD(P)H] [Planctomycetes bacterium]|nr:methylenetetrahydrofolate reductase [NAD(P)H] [Planctomycetota bacterium]MCB9909713.1 methylenetetrahydrofolate reductase [NAD(P)H] [Planctomycetota bacterium]MCB9911798.1 methylenetetrahydrofolate reductase [NAD(P)H] [Planctomycetota bacterium]HPF15164.1 methylenetetrahydrofolate reductase [NAD(P)H] [Planctomycetota bacterium]
MKIQECYRSHKPVFSFEFFPPKTLEGENNLMNTVADLQSAVEPDFVSVTYGAGGSTREHTHRVVVRVQKELGITAMAHQTCVADTVEGIRANMRQLAAGGVQNILALRGDKPQTDGTEAPQAFSNATDLIDLLREEFDFSVGAACYPETHPESTEEATDLHWTAEKVRRGAQFLITQLFFDSSQYFDYVAKVRALGIEVPIVPGIMPITNVGQVERFTKMCGASIPESLLSRLRHSQEDPGAVMAIGIEHAIEQCRKLLEGGAPGLHFYTLNRSHATRGILAALRKLA